jgi:acyl carrier protein
MAFGTATTPGVLPSAAAIEQVVLDAMVAASADKAVPLSAETDVLEIVDSLGLMMALANIQKALNISLNPKEIIAALQARSISELALVLEAAVRARGAPQV